LFEFKMSYMEQGYHKPGERPFSFPPAGIDNKINANLIEIQGRNGTGKTTLLNCLALATGYLDHEKDLETKPALRGKLEKLNENPTLEYCFRICCDKPEPIDLKIERTREQKPKCWLNSKAVDLDTVNKKFDIVFLTEDDPGKVVTATLGKLSKYFSELGKGISDIQSSITGNLQDIADFRDFEKKKSDTLQEIVACDNTIRTKGTECEELAQKLKQVEMKNEIKGKLELLDSEKEITSNYEDVKKKYDQVKDKKDANIIRSLYRERSNLDGINAELKRIDAAIVQICDSLAHYGIRLQVEKLLKNDYSEINLLNQKMQPRKREETIQMRMIDDFIALLNRYLENDIVPINNKTVRETLSELMKLKARLATDRVFALLTVLNNSMGQRKTATLEFDKVSGKISALTQKSKDLKDIEEVQSAFIKAEEKYLALQVALGQDKTNLLSTWRKVSLVDGDPVAIQSKMRELEVTVEAQKTMKTKYEEKLRILREDSTVKPKYEEKEQRLKALYESIFRLRESIAQWTGILENSESARGQFAPEKEKPGFGLADYDKFVRAVGEYLGSQFEPIPFDYKLHNVKFFDIERRVFITTDGREIASLSQGQSKITSLTGSFRKMDPGKKKIVLIDEISELDPQNLEDVKNTLKIKLDEGSLLLAILVRPSSEMIRIEGWGWE